MTSSKKNRYWLPLAGSLIVWLSGCGATDGGIPEGDLREAESISADVELYAEHHSSAKTKAATEDRLRNFSIALAKAVHDPEVGEVLKEHLAKKFDGDYDVLWSSVKAERPRGVALDEIVRTHLPDEGQTDIERIPFLNVAMPVNFDKWDGTAPVLVTYVPTTLDDRDLTTLDAYDANGKRYVLDAWEEPDVPVLVVGINERMDPLTGRVYPEYAALAVDDGPSRDDVLRDPAVDAVAGDPLGEGLSPRDQLEPMNDLTSKGVQPEALGTTQQAVGMNGFPDFFLQWLYLYNDHEPWAKGSAEILVMVLVDSGKKVGPMRFTEKNDGNFYNLKSRLFTYGLDLTRYVAVRLDEDDGGTPIKVNLGLTNKPKLPGIGELAIDLKTEFTIHDSDDHIGVNELIDLRVGPRLATLDTHPGNANNLERAGDGAVSFWWRKVTESLVGAKQMFPFNDMNVTSGRGNEWDISTFTDGEDFAYMLDIGSSIKVDITTCNSFTNFDTMIELFDANGAKGLMNDDDFSCPFGIRQSTLRGVFLNPGVYWLVVDGFGGATGQFHITISPSP